MYYNSRVLTSGGVDQFRANQVELLSTSDK